MSAAPHDQKNDESFEAITRPLNEALRKIEKDVSLSATVAELARQANVHRNTIYHRKWPLEKLAQIKENRAQQKKSQASSKASELSPEKLLEQSRLEVIYWLTQLQDARASITSLNTRNKETEGSRNFYMKPEQERLATINKKISEIRKLQDVRTARRRDFDHETQPHF